MPQDAALKQTPLYPLHLELGAKMVPFAGWHMPIQYSKGVIHEHLAVRNGVGIFDVSHMGEVTITGPEAGKLTQHLVTNDIEKMQSGAVLYTLMCHENGGIVDDLLVYKLAGDHYFLCVNASNASKDYQWIARVAAAYRAEVKDISAATAQLAIQGQHAEALLQKLSDVSLNEVKYYHFKTGKIHQIDCIISRTGYTGEDGFELYFDAARAVDLARAIFAAGKEFDLEPIGLGARDTLRLEMGYALYGNEIDAGTSPLESGLNWVVKLNKSQFIGRDALLKQKEQGLARQLVALKLLEKGVPRSHYQICAQGQPVGEITSGSHSPCLKTGIALARVAKEFAANGARLEVKIREQMLPAEVVPLPFVPRKVKK